MLFFIFIVLLFYSGIANGCNYTFASLDDNITVSSSTDLYGIVDAINVIDVATGALTMAADVFLDAPSPYFQFENPFLVVAACLPAGLTEQLTFLIAEERDCKPRHLTVNVEHTVPEFSRLPSKLVIKVDTCTVGRSVVVYNLTITNEGGCADFICWVECDNCRDKFWITRSKVIRTLSVDIEFNRKYQLTIKCADNSAIVPSSDIIAVTLIARFERVDSCRRTTLTSRTTALYIPSTSHIPSHMTTTRNTLSVTSRRTQTTGSDKPLASTKISEIILSSTIPSVSNMDHTQAVKLPTSASRPAKLPLSTTSMNDPTSTTNSVNVPASVITSMNVSMSATISDGVSAASKSSLGVSGLVTALTDVPATATSSISVPATATNSVYIQTTLEKDLASVKSSANVPRLATRLMMVPTSFTSTLNVQRSTYVSTPVTSSANVPKSDTRLKNSPTSAFRYTCITESPSVSTKVSRPTKILSSATSATFVAPPATSSMEVSRVTQAPTSVTNSSTLSNTGARAVIFPPKEPTQGSTFFTKPPNVSNTFTSLAIAQGSGIISTSTTSSTNSVGETDSDRIFPMSHLVSPKADKSVSTTRSVKISFSAFSSIAAISEKLQTSATTTLPSESKKKHSVPKLVRLNSTTTFSPEKIVDSSLSILSTCDDSKAVPISISSTSTDSASSIAYFQSTSAFTTTTVSSIITDKMKGRFFDKPANIAAVSIVCSVLLLGAVITLIYAMRYLCCRSKIAQIGIGRNEEEMKRKDIP